MMSSDMCGGSIAEPCPARVRRVGREEGAGEQVAKAVQSRVRCCADREARQPE